MLDPMRRTLRAALLFALTPFFLGLSNVQAYPSGAITIASYPLMAPMGSINVVTHAQWSGVIGKTVVSQLFLTHKWGQYSVRPAQNAVPFNGHCSSGCKSDDSNGSLDTTFTLTPEPTAPVNGVVLNPTQITIYATLYLCFNTTESCDALATSQLVTIFISGS